MRSPVDYFYGASLRAHEVDLPQVKIGSRISHDKMLCNESPNDE